MIEFMRIQSERPTEPLPPDVRDEISSVLRSAKIFSRCTEDDLNVIGLLSGMIDLKADERIFAAGESSERLYFVRKGSVVIRKNDDEGRSVEIARFLSGDIFGDLDFFTGQNRNADAYTEGSSSLVVFPLGEDGLDHLSRSYPGLYARLLYTFLGQISARIRGVNALVKENSPLVNELKRQVYVDKLTGLHNKTFFEETLTEVLQKTDDSVGLLMYKPDNFKEINDTYGHEAGDKALRFIADGLKSFVSNSDLLFRYMGNENAIIRLGADQSELRRTAEETGDFLRGLDLSSILRGKEIALSVSFGLVLSPEHGHDAVLLANKAHELVMEGRRRGGNRILFPEDLENT